MPPIVKPTAWLLVVCGCTCREPQPSGHEPTTAPRSAASDVLRAGVPIDTAFYRIRASAAEDCPAPDPALIMPGKRRVRVELSIEPLSDLQVPANPYYARLVDADRNVYEATLGGCGPALAPTLPARGQTAHGAVVFDVPPSARTLTLLYAPELVGTETAVLAIELGR